MFSTYGTDNIHAQNFINYYLFHRVDLNISKGIKNKDDFDALDPNEVENVSFLKDAASASIYGSSAGNGVVLVATKSGSIQKPKFQYKGSYSASNPTRPIQSFSAVEELQYVNNTAVTKDQPKPYGEDVIGYFDNRSR